MANQLGLYSKMNFSMKAISIRQPWANLIIEGKKIIEIRKSNTDYRGLLLIHAARIRGINEFKRANIDPQSKNLYVEQAIIGFVILKDVVKLSRKLWLQTRDKHLIPEEWSDEKIKYAWILESPRKIKPIYYLGLPKIFSVSESVVKKIYSEHDSLISLASSSKISIDT